MTLPLLNIENLSLSLGKTSSSYQILKDISFRIYPGEIVGLVGESGCGKSLTASAILGLLPPLSQLTGYIEFEGQNLIKHISSLRGTRLSLILQDPSLALNPLIPIGRQLIEGLCYHKKMSRKAAVKIGTEWLDRVGISDASTRMRQYPHEMSGGMKQRILIAIALICQPSLLIADEPTTALDVTIQAQILDLLQNLQKEKGMSLLLITHDLGIIARCCQRVMVMYAGQLVETGPVEQVLTSPRHPYTQALLQSRRSLAQVRDQSLICLEGKLGY
jgi:peptide/nickel transport system ATP-binding protein/oligopeptide transport system ATP-binding protein